MNGSIKLIDTLVNQLNEAKLDGSTGESVFYPGNRMRAVMGDPLSGAGTLVFEIWAHGLTPVNGM